GQGVAATLVADDRDLLEARARLHARAVIVGSAHALAGAVVDAPSQIGVDLFPIIGIEDGEPRAGGGLGALQAVLAHLRGDVHVVLAWQEPVLLHDLALGAIDGAVVRDAAFLVGDDDLHAVREDQFLQNFFVLIAFSGG